MEIRDLGYPQTVEVFASDCDFEFEDFLVRTYFLGDEGVPGRSTTTLLTVSNLCSDGTPALTTAQLLAVGSPILDEYVNALDIVEFDEAVKHGDVGVPDKIYGEEVVCYVVPRKDADVTADQLTVYCTDHLPTPKLPKAFYFVDALPKNDRGKIRRDDLKRIWSEQESASP